MVAAAIVAGAVVSGVASSSASNSAANSAKSAANKNNKLAAAQRAETKATLDPYINRGNKAGDLINSFLGLNGDQAGQQAFQTWLNSSDYAWTTDQGSKAIESAAAARGGLFSGKTGKDLVRFGQNNARQYSNQWLGALGGQQQTGLSAANALAGVGTNLVAQQTANNNNAASAAANGALTGAANFNDFLGTALQAYGRYGQSSFQDPTPASMNYRGQY